MTIEASTTRVDANKPPSSGTVVDVESDEKQATTPDPRWPYLNRWSSNPLHEASAPAALKLVPPHSPTGSMVETESGTSLTDNAIPPSLTHDQESSLVSAAHDSSSVSDIHNSSLVTAVHDSPVAVVNESLIVAIDEVIEDKAPPPASSDLIGVDDKDELNENENTAQKNTFVQSLGAWSKPLHFTPPPPQLGVSEAVQCQIHSFWPTIGEAIVNGPKTKKGQRLVPEQAKSHLPLLQNSSASGVDHPEPNSRSPITRQTHETFKNPLVTLPPKDAFASPVTHSHEVHSDPCSQINHTLPLLAVEKAAPVQSHIMESIPSHSTFLEDSEASKIEQPFDHRSPLTLDHHNFHTEDTPPVYGKGNGFDVVGDSSSYTITRGGRTIKQTQKVQDMGWIRASGRGKKGHRGRGNRNH
ncbi:hypothetical protein Bca4012_041343 [Brassica carinata]